MPRAKGTRKATAKAPAKPVEHRLRWPTGMTLAPSATTCARCPDRPMVLAAVINGLDTKLDPLPLSATGLAAAVAAGRWIYVCNPAGPPLVHRAKSGHHWIKGYRADHRPILLARHDHGHPPHDHDPQLAGELLTRLLPPPPWDPATADTDPPF